VVAILYTADYWPILVSSGRLIWCWALILPQLKTTSICSQMWDSSSIENQFYLLTNMGLFFNRKPLTSAHKCGCLKLLFQPGNLNSLVVVNFFLSQEINKRAKLACVHDSARPLVLPKDISKVGAHLSIMPQTNEVVKKFTSDPANSKFSFGKFYLQLVFIHILAH
jgi:hypothetical protein